MYRRRILTIVVPISTFSFGILVQVLIGQWITFSNIVPLSIVAIIICLVAIIIILELADKRFDDVDTQLRDIANRVGLRADYIEDSYEGKSYKKSTELVENAKFSLIAVGTWEPFPQYQANKTNIKAGDSDVVNARRKFYEAVKKQIERHLNDGTPFYRRIVQVPEEYIRKRIPFETDPIFYNHLLYIAENQSSGKRSCILRKTVTFMQIHFTIIDDQYIIIPILTTIKDELQARYGEIIINDTQGELVRQLQAIYWTIENRSNPIDVDELRL